MADVACPVCSEVGRTGALVLRQINAEEGIYVCNNSQCPYPVGISDNTIQISVPELREISNEPTKNDEQGQDLAKEGANDCPERAQEKAAIINEYEVNILLDPELDSLMQEL